MKKIFYFIIPVVIIAIAATYFKGNSSTVSAVKSTGTNAAASCMMTPQDFVKADKSDAVIIDVRTQREYDYGHLDGAVVIDIYQRDFRDKINQLDKSKTYYVYCKTGIRSRSAVSYMRQSGFEKVCDLQGGVNYLARAGVEFVR
jgi:rhodanese-related sulfurtransferase